MGSPSYSSVDSDFWAADAEAEGRFGGIAIGRPKSASEVKSIRLSRRKILKEVVKNLGGSKPLYRTWRGYVEGCYHCYVSTAIPAGDGQIYEVHGSGHGSSTVAEENAAENLILSLEMKLGFEVDDVNWGRRVQYYRDRYDLYGELQNVREKNGVLTEVANRLELGWDQTLKSVGQMSRLSSEANSAAIGAQASDGAAEDVCHTDGVCSVLEEYSTYVSSRDSDRFESISALKRQHS